MRGRTLTAVAVAGALVAPATSVAAPRVNVMVVGKSRVFFSPHSLVAGRTAVTVGRHRCGVAAGTPLAALAAARRAHGPRFYVSDYGACNSNPANSAGLYVARVSRERAHGRDGWYYKVGRRAGSSGGGDPSGPFGNGRRLRSGQRVSWFWCHFSGASCQRTLEVTPATTHSTRGLPLKVTVRGYDDFGKGVPVGGATVRLGGSQATTGADGTATVMTPLQPGLYRVSATHLGLVPAFPEAVRAG